MGAEVWTTGGHRAPERFDAWREALSLTHLEWDLEAAPQPDFRARISQRRLDGIRVVECRCDPCTGWRRRPQISRSEEPCFGILFNLRGREVVRQHGDEAVLRPGDFVMWDSDRAMEFRVLEPLQKLTLLVPKARMQALCGDADRYAGTVVPGSGGVAGIAAEALRRLARDFAKIEEHEATAAIEPVLSLLAATLMARRPAHQVTEGHLDSFRNACRYIEDHLGDGDLTPSQVACAQGVSLRYLHAVFFKQDTSVGQWIRERRLFHCHRELSQTRQTGTITTIAFRWGFNSMAHFSRAFKSRYSVSPKEVRRST